MHYFEVYSDALASTYLNPEEEAYYDMWLAQQARGHQNFEDDEFLNDAEEFFENLEDEVHYNLDGTIYDVRKTYSLKLTFASLPRTQWTILRYKWEVLRSLGNPPLSIINLLITDYHFNAKELE